MNPILYPVDSGMSSLRSHPGTMACEVAMAWASKELVSAGGGVKGTLYLRTVTDLN